MSGGHRKLSRVILLDCGTYDGLLIVGSRRQDEEYCGLSTLCGVSGEKQYNDLLTFGSLRRDRGYSGLLTCSRLNSYLN